MSVLHYAFTGTQGQHTREQKDALNQLFRELKYSALELGFVVHLHHGVCVGLDNLADRLAFLNGITRELHPGINPKYPQDISKRAMGCYLRMGFILHEAKPFLVRNKEMVDVVGSTLIAAPAQNGLEYEQVRSGTWSTIRYARKKSKNIIYVWPDGRVERF